MAETATEVSVKGSVPDTMRTLARDKFNALAARCREPVRTIEVRLVNEPNPSREKPAVVEAVINIDGRPIRAHVAASRMGEAIDLAYDHLARRVERAEARLHRVHDRHETGEPGEHQWRHGDLPRSRPDYFPRPPDEREVVRRKTFALDPISLDEAAFDLDQLGHDFYLFTELTTESDCLIAHRDDGTYEVHCAGPTAPDPSGCAAPITVKPSYMNHASLTDAQERLDATEEPFVVFRSSETGRGNVLYRRRDGHYGLITPG